MSAPSSRELEVMRHALGADSRLRGYRNYYCTNSDDQLLNSMVSKGYMIAGGKINDGRDQYFKVSDDWCKVLGIVLQ